MSRPLSDLEIALLRKLRQDGEAAARLLRESGVNLDEVQPRTYALEQPPHAQQQPYVPHYTGQASNNVAGFVPMMYNTQNLNNRRAILPPQQGFMQQQLGMLQPSQYHAPPVPQPPRVPAQAIPDSVLRAGNRPNAPPNQYSTTAEQRAPSQRIRVPQMYNSLTDAIAYSSTVNSRAPADVSDSIPQAPGNGMVQNVVVPLDDRPNATTGPSNIILEASSSHNHSSAPQPVGTATPVPTLPSATQAQKTSNRNVVPNLTQDDIRNIQKDIIKWTQLPEVIALDKAYFDFGKQFGWGIGWKVCKAPEGMFVLDSQNLSLPLVRFFERLQEWTVRDEPKIYEVVDGTTGPAVSNTAQPRPAQPHLPPPVQQQQPVQQPPPLPIQQQQQQSAVPRPPILAQQQQQPYYRSGEVLPPPLGPQPYYRTNTFGHQVSTPPPPPAGAATVRSPAQANKKTMARDLLLAFGKRVRTHSVDSDEPPPKRTGSIRGDEPPHEPTPTSSSRSSIDPTPTIHVPALPVVPDAHTPVTERRSPANAGHQSTENIEPPHSLALGDQESLPHPHSPKFAHSAEESEIRPPTSPVTHGRPPASPSEAAEPLFLPTSPPSSRATTPAPVIDLTLSRAEPRRNRNYAYVLIPGPPPHTIRYREIQEEKKLSEKGKGKAEEEVESDVEPECSCDYTEDAQGNHLDDPHERAIMQIASTRVRVVPCKWGDCDVLANSNKMLFNHLKKCHQPASQLKKTFICMWKGCGVECKIGDRHFMTHAFAVFPCPYQGCKAVFESIHPLCNHAKEHAAIGGELFSRSIALLPPKTLAEPPSLPKTCNISEREVYPAIISAEQHQKLTPWIKKQISGLWKPGYDKRRRIKLPPKDANDSDEETEYRYDYLTNYSHRYSSHLSIPVEERFAPLDAAPLRDGLTYMLGGNEEGEEGEGSSTSGNTPSSRSSRQPGVRPPESDFALEDREREMSADPIGLRSPSPELQQVRKEGDTTDEEDVQTLLTA